MRRPLCFCNTPKSINSCKLKHYLIQTERLGLRNWLPSDEAPFTAMCKDREVMRHFPGVLTSEETRNLINMLSEHFHAHGFTYFAMDLLKSGEFIGFTGLKYQTWESEYTPCVDIGWRLKRAAWGQGYATEAALACLDAAGPQFGIQKVLSFATDTNRASEHVMKKIGMEYIGTVQHPAILGDPRFQYCVVYEKMATD